MDLVCLMISIAWLDICDICGNESTERRSLLFIAYRDNIKNFEDRLVYEQKLFVEIVSSSIYGYPLDIVAGNERVRNRPTNFCDFFPRRIKIATIKYHIAFDEKIVNWTFLLRKYEVKMNKISRKKIYWQITSRSVFSTIFLYHASHWNNFMSGFEVQLFVTRS